MAQHDAFARPVQKVGPRLQIPDGTTAYLLLLPSLAVFAVFVVYPVVNTFVAAFSDIDSLGRVVRFGTLTNFQALSRDEFLPAIISQTILFTLGSVVATAVIAFALALILNSQFPGRGLAKALVLIPWAMPFAIAAMAWRWIFNGEVGSLNYFLSLLGLIREPVVWLSDPRLAFLTATFVNIWSSVPFMTVTFLAGLQGLPGHVYDAARMDGAASWQEFRDMTIPLMRNVIMVVTLLSIIWTFRSFSVIWILTQGQPIHRTDIVVTYLYELAFQNNTFGTGFALAVAMFIALALFSFAYVKVLSGREVKE
jgi:multiple sugar transport system permease protein